MRRQYPQDQRAWLADLVEDLGETARATLLESGYTVNLEENEKLQPVQECVVRVEVGMVKLSVQAPDRSLVVGLYGPDDTLLSPLYHAWSRPLYFIQAQEASTVRVIPQSAVLEACQANASFGRNVLRQFSWDAWMMMDRIHSLAFHNLPQRVAQVLINLSAMMGRLEDNKVKLGLRLTQEELAELAGARRETLSTVLQDLREDNILDIRYARIDIKNYKKLQELAKSEPLPYLRRSVTGHVEA